MSRILAAVLAVVSLVNSADAQDFGALARVDASGSTVRDGFWGRETTLELALSQGVPWRVYTLDAPRRLVIDFREVDWTGLDPDSFDQSDIVDAVRVGTFRPGWSRLVADLNEPMALDEAGLVLSEDGGMARLTIKLQSTDEDSFVAASGAPHDPRWDLPAPAAIDVVPNEPLTNRPLRVMLDPGHGGIDPGAEAGGVDEADLMLAFALELQEALLRAGNFEVFLSREADVFVSLEGRVAAAQRARADVFLSLHADALDAGQARGATVYILSEDATDAASEALAERHDRGDILAGVDLTGSDDRVTDVLIDLARVENAPRSLALGNALVSGILDATGNIHKRPLRRAGFSVLKAADIPSALIEVGFLSTQQDLDNLTNPAWRADMAAGIRDGLQDWVVEDMALSDLRRQ